jgi:hypothetical protein
MKKNNLILLILFPLFVHGQCVDSDAPSVNGLRTPLGSTVKIWDWTNLNDYGAYIHNESGPPLFFDMRSPIRTNSW